LIEDAKFETVTNLEFEKRERTLSSRNSISEEEEEVFAHNGELISPVDSEPPHLILLQPQNIYTHTIKKLHRFSSTPKGHTIA
jgi:hypothetical protein